MMTAMVALEEARVCAMPQPRVLDLGCGIGSVLCMLAWGLPAAQCVGVEAQPASVVRALRAGAGVRRLQQAEHQQAYQAIAGIPKC